MWVFTIIARPNSENKEFKDIGGAYVNAWIDFKDQAGAEALARFYIENEDWIPEKTRDVGWLTISDYDKDDKNRGYLQEAEENGSCLVFHQWPKDAIDDDHDYEETRH
ncbi:MAG: hypothetical protein ACYTFM_10890 [Planctomycetota bacterium]|jgi:hypothetical protein